MSTFRLILPILLTTLASFQNGLIAHTPELMPHEPKAIISYQKNKTARSKRNNMRDRLNLVATRLHEVESAESVAPLLSRIDHNLTRLHRELSAHTTQPLSTFKPILSAHEQEAERARKLRMAIRLHKTTQPRS